MNKCEHSIVFDLDDRFTEYDAQWLEDFYEKGFEELSIFLGKRMAFWKYLEPDGFV